MAKIINLSNLKKEDIPIISLAGTTYLIDGNFKSEYALALNETINDIQKARKANDVNKVYSILKAWVYELISMNKEGSYIDDATGETIHVTHKDVTMETIDKEFNDYQVIEVLLSNIFQLINE